MRMTRLRFLVASLLGTTGQAWQPISPPRISRSLSSAGSCSQLNAISAGFGSSSLESCFFAAEAAVLQAKEALGEGKTPSIAFVSTTAARDIDAIVDSLKTLLPDTPIHGLTSSGAVLTTSGSLAKGFGVLLLSSDEPGTFATAYDKQDGTKAVAALKDKMLQPQAIFMSATPGAEEAIVETLASEFPDVPVFGGTAADDDLSGQWKVLSSDDFSGTGVSLVGIGEGVKFGASMEGPYTVPTKDFAVATKTDGRRVYEIDGKPAADYFAEKIDDVKDQVENGGLVLPQTAQTPIGIRQPLKGLVKQIESKIPLLKRLVDADKDYEYITAHLAAFGGGDEKYVDFFVPIPEGSQLVMMDSGDGPSTGYGQAMEDALEHAQFNLGEDTKPKAGLMVFCGGMAIAVGDQLDSGIATVAPQLEGVPVMGMACFGEQGQLPLSGKNVQRNLSTGFVLFG